MKLIHFLLFIVLLFFSCKKDNELKEFKSKIAGTWEYERTVSFINSPPAPLGNGKIIVITEEGIFERKSHDTLLFRGSYVLNKKDDCYPRTSTITFQTNENTGGYINYIGIENGKLSFATPNCWADGGITYYRRIR